MPTWRLRLRWPVQVSTRSPSPLRPASVSGRPPIAVASREISTRPRVMSAAIALCPRPRLSTTPAAIATTFLSAPPISTPATSSVAYSRSDGPRNSLLDEARRLGGRSTPPRPPSAARPRPRPRSVGPDSTATGRDGPASSAITCDIAEERAVLEPLGGADERHRRPARSRRRDGPRRAGPATAPRRRPAWRRRRRPRSTRSGRTPSTSATPGR